MTLQQVSDLTLINVQFLEAIEQDNLSFLPPAYVRAFIREYALAVGMDPRRAMKLHDAGVASTKPAPQVRDQRNARIPETHGSRMSLTDMRKTLFGRRPAWLVTVAIAVFTVIIVALALQDGSPEIATQEIPFQSMVEEAEERVGASVANQEAMQPATPTPPADSLTLTAVITDSVWFHLLIDDQKPLEYIFPPNRRKTWKARKKFLVTLGNAGAVEFNLNDKTIGILGETGAVIRNVEFTRQTLDTE
ncbi:MAG: RodZ domain-containing protein [Bacteroidota bacterium]